MRTNSIKALIALLLLVGIGACTDPEGFYEPIEFHSALELDQSFQAEVVDYRNYHFGVTYGDVTYYPGRN